jgi:hypothetical protein
MLNAPREIPYQFKVFELDGWVWLFDDSERTYICSSSPSIWAEPVYALAGEVEDWTPDADYFSPDDSAVHRAKLIAEWPAETPEKEAWDEAREDACANHRI